MFKPGILAVRRPLRAACALLGALSLVAGASARASGPIALVASADGTELFVAGERSRTLITVERASGRIVRTTELPAPPTGLALSRNGAQLYVTCAAPEGLVCIVNRVTGTIAARIPAGHTALAPVVGADGKTLYVCNRFDDSISVIDLLRKREVARIAVAREPIAAALTPDGRQLFVAHHLHDGPADVDYVAATVSVVDTAARRVARRIRLPNGSGLLRDVRVSPDGRYAGVTHLLARFHLPTTQLERGWINTNALSLIDVARGELLHTVLLDTLSAGAANPWAVAWSADGRTICVTHAGTHELSVIDADALLAKLHALPPGADPSSDLAFLVGLRRRIPVEGNGPRALALVGTQACVANHFSDTLSLIDLAAPPARAMRVSLGATGTMPAVRRGEMLWNDGSICFQGWQSCSSCHSSDARVDGLNWDNLNDGIGNPKNAKSLLFAHQTPPSMWTGVREDAPMAVRAGIKHILFAVLPPEDEVALDRYLESLRPTPSPRLVKGRLSPAAERGRRIFASEATGCARCHSGALFTDLKSYPVGTAGAFDLPDEAFDTPTLIELWRTAPYLHDGSAATMRDVLTTRNAENRHGNTRHLKPQEIDDLAEYLLSL